MICVAAALSAAIVSSVILVLWRPAGVASAPSAVSAQEVQALHLRLAVLEQSLERARVAQSASSFNPPSDQDTALAAEVTRLQRELDRLSRAERAREQSNEQRALKQVAADPAEAKARMFERAREADRRFEAEPAQVFPGLEESVSAAVVAALGDVPVECRGVLCRLTLPQALQDAGRGAAALPDEVLMAMQAEQGGDLSVRYGVNEAGQRIAYVEALL